MPASQHGRVRTLTSCGMTRVAEFYGVTVLEIEQHQAPGLPLHILIDWNGSGERRQALERQITGPTRESRKTECHIVGVETSFPKPGQALVSTTASNAARRKPLQ